jgi:glycosyltransferase involved in cell wall biosynthesis
MRASVLIGAHNEGSRLWRTVESILESGIGKSAEIVVADDASSDDSVSELKKRFPQIVVVEQPERSGVSSTRGLAVRQARGDTLVFLDGHTKPGRGSIERLVSSVERTSGKAIITPRIEGLDGETWKSLPQQLVSGYALDLETFDSWWISEKKMKEVKVGGQTYFESPALVGCSLAVSRDLYDHLWGFDVHMRQYGVEDLDFALKAWLMGSRVLHDPEATVAHRFQHLFSGYEVGAEYPLANQIRSARKNFTQSAWEEWVERAQENNRKRLADHPEGLWARAWEIFQKDRASAEQERSHLMAKRVRDEFWFARRF